MTTAVYIHQQPSRADLDLIAQGTAGDKVITNFPLATPHVRYLFQKKAKNKAAVWGDGYPTHPIKTEDFPFNWMLTDAKPAALVSALAKDADRIMLLFPKNRPIPALLVFLAFANNKTVKVFKGGMLQDITLQSLPMGQVQKEYETLVLPAIKPLPVPDQLMTTPNGTTVRPYQQQMIDFALERDACGWFVDMGLGKTLATLVLIDQWIKRGEISPEKPILIVAPIMVALDTWKREVDKWGYDWNVITNIRPTPKKREQTLKDLLLPMEKPTLFLTNPDQLKPIKEYYFSLNISFPFEVLIIDELSQYKSPNTKRNTIITYYRRPVKKFLGLTGTPASNSLLNIWNQLKLIDRKDTAWAGQTIYEFQDKYFNAVATNRRGIVTKWAPKFGAEGIIFRNLAKDAISMRTEGLVELPPISYSTLYIQLPEQARKEYTTLENEIAEELELQDRVTYVTDDGVSVFLPNSDVLSGKLLQLAGGALYTDTQTHQFAIFHDEKLNALDDLIESATSPLLVFYYFTSDRIRIQERYKNKIPVLDSKDKNVQDMITRWNNGEIPVMLAHPASVGHGLNLQEGGHTVVWFSYPNWDNDKYQQANKRLYRSGQTHPVNVIHIVAKNTIEEVMLRSLKSKQKVNDRLMGALDRAERRQNV